VFHFAQALLADELREFRRADLAQVLQSRDLGLAAELVELGSHLTIRNKFVLHPFRPPPASPPNPGTRLDMKTVPPIMPLAEKC
jgi:hypothetical protein